MICWNNIFGNFKKLKNLVNSIREAVKTKNVPNCGKTPKGGGQRQNQISLHFKTHFDWGGGSKFFRFFPNSNNWNMTFLACLLPSLNACCLPACLLPSLILMIYETAIGEIYATFGTYMAYIWIKYSPLSVWYDLGTVLARFRGGATISK